MTVDRRSADAEHEAPPAAAPAAAAPAALGNRALAALAVAAPEAALARAVADRRVGNRAAAAMLQRDLPKTTADLHQQVYGDSALAHAPSGPAPEAYEFSDDPLADGGYGPADSTIRVKPGPVRVDFIRPRPEPPTPSGQWLEDALKRDKLLKELPDWAREKAIDALKDADEMVAEKIIDALPWDAKTKGAATAALKSLLQLAKGKTFKMPEAPPGTREPDWGKAPDFQKMPGQVIIPGPVWRW